MMAEIIKVQPEGSIRQETDKLSHAFEIRCFAVWREPHHLVFVAVVRESEILRQRLVEDAERVRKIDSLRHRKIRSRSKAPGRAGKISKTVHRYSERLLERRHVK